jgi:cytochrome c biogenesis protein CcmG, thiol:disulfide interchange protein DsbE
MKRLLFLAPLLAFLVLAGYLGFGLTRDPQKVPSALIDRPAPSFALPAVPGLALAGLGSDALRGEVTIVNVFASWCQPCRVEHPIFMRLARENAVPILGINYKDKAEDARKWLADLGNPYRAIGYDFEGRVSIDWGVYGVPETFVVDRAGTIRFKHVGPVTPAVLDDMLKLIAQLKRTT